MADNAKPLPSHLPTAAELMQEFAPSRRQAVESLLPPPPNSIFHYESGSQPQPEEWIRREKQEAQKQEVETVVEEGIEESDVLDAEGRDLSDGWENDAPAIRTIIVQGTPLT